MNIVRLNNLYDQYKELLTDKQRSYFEDYHFADLSLSEIADNYKVSRNAIHKQIKDTENKLEDYELKLGLLSKRELVLRLIKEETNPKTKEELEKLL